MPWPEGKPFRILSLDGGGIKGLYSASLLAIIEEKLTDGKPVAEYFDMIAGTSTGGVIAIALGLKKPAAQIRRLYVERGNRIFPPWRRRLSALAFAWQMFFPLHSHKALEAELYALFGNARYGDSESRLVVPAFLVPSAEIVVLKTDHHQDFKNDWKMLAWEAARATSAAPTFLRGHEGEDHVFLDGGVWANNPIMCAVVDALSAYNVRPEQIHVLSIGTGNVPFEIGKAAARGGLWSWREIIRAAIYLTTDNAASQAGLLLGPERILRLEPKEGGATIALDDWEAAVRVLPELSEQDFQAACKDLAPFFDTGASARHRFYT